ncbi:MAG: hypothetical protein FAF03_07305 [Epsilonproteobacteria bacterium]|nr:hypothetical protein [Campylobacterota bacterium]
MNKTLILIAAIAMTTLTVQANETMDAIGQAVSDAVQVTSASTDDAQDAQDNEKNETKSEEKIPEER